MTLAKAVERLRTRVEVDLDAEVDLDQNSVAVDELLEGANRVLKVIHGLFTTSAVVLDSTNLSFDTLDANVCSARIWKIDEGGVMVNGTWLTEYLPRDFHASFPIYTTNPHADTPAGYYLVQESKFQISAALTTAGAAGDHLVRGWRLHEVYDYDNYQNTELEGPSEWHELYIDSAAIAATKSFNTETGARRRKDLMAEHGEVLKDLAKRHLAKYKRERIQPMVGTERSVFGIGCRL